jgi:hypothetical protein
MKLSNEFRLINIKSNLTILIESECLKMCSNTNKLCAIMTFVEHKKTAHGFDCHLSDFDINRIYVSTQDKRISVSFPM